MKNKAFSDEYNMIKNSPEGHIAAYFDDVLVRLHDDKLEVKVILKLAWCIPKIEVVEHIPASKKHCSGKIAGSCVLSKK